MSMHVDRLLFIGGLLSNVAFNWKQRPGYVLTEHDCAELEGLQRQWDAARNDYRASTEETETARGRG